MKKFIGQKTKRKSLAQYGQLPDKYSHDILEDI